MSTAVRLDGAKNVHIHNVVTRGFDTGIDASNSTGVISKYSGNDIFLSDRSDFLIVNSRPDGISLDPTSRVELFNTIANQILRLTESGEDRVVEDLRYYSERIIEAQSFISKYQWVRRLKQRIESSRYYLDWIGRGWLVREILDKLI